jgi:DNA polymerase III subunit delta'
MFEGFHGNQRTTRALTRMLEQERIPQTLLLAGPQGVGKATLARRLAAALVGDADKIERDDLSLPHNVSVMEEREKWPAERRAEDPLLFASQLDFVTFPPDGPLRQISIQQMRLLKDRARFRPQHGSRRVFLIDHLDRANEQAANSLLKTLEEPPDHLILVLTAENAQDLLPTIRSRAIQFHLGPLSPAEMASFVGPRGLDQPERRIRLAAGSPGRAVSLDLEDYDRRKTAMLALLEAASGATPFAAWLEHADSVAAAREEKLEAYLSVLYGLLQDLLAVQQSNGDVRNPELAEELAGIAQRVSFQWVRAAVRKVDELVSLLRRNIQKSIALDALILDLRASMKIA